MGRLPEAWIAPATRALRELVRHHAKLLGLHTSVKCQVHAMVAAAGVPVAMSDLFGAEGYELLRHLELGPSSRARIYSPPGMISARDWEVELFQQPGHRHPLPDPDRPHLSQHSIPLKRAAKG